MDLAGKLALVTGGNGALGRAVAQRAQAAGARVVLLDRGFDTSLQAAYDCRACDLTAPGAVAAALGGITVDALFNIAGGFDMGLPVTAADDAQWEAMFAMNVATLRGALKAVVPGMLQRGQGAVVNVGALSAREGKAQMSAYTAAKAVVMNLTESLAAESARRGVRVNAVLPSIIDTPANRSAMPDADFGAWVAPDALADAMVFLASDAARGIHGALLPVTAAQA